MAKRRPPQYDLPAVEVQPLGEIGPAAGDQLHSAQFTKVGQTSSGHPLGQADWILYAGDAGDTLDTARNFDAICHHSPRLALGGSRGHVTRNRMRQ